MLRFRAKTRMGNRSPTEGFPPKTAVRIGTTARPIPEMPVFDMPIIIAQRLAIIQWISDKLYDCRITNMIPVKKSK